MSSAENEARRLLVRMFGGNEGQQVYTFHRSEGFYPLALNDDEQARANALCNPGTIKVVNEITGAVVWPDA